MALELADRPAWCSLTTIETVAGAERWRVIVSRLPARRFFADRHDVHVEDPQAVARMLAWFDKP